MEHFPLVGETFFCLRGNISLEERKNCPVGGAKVSLLKGAKVFHFYFVKFTLKQHLFQTYLAERGTLKLKLIGKFVAQ